MIKMHNIWDFAPNTDINITIKRPKIIYELEVEDEWQIFNIAMLGYLYEDKGGKPWSTASYKKVYNLYKNLDEKFFAFHDGAMEIAKNNEDVVNYLAGLQYKDNYNFFAIKRISGAGLKGIKYPDDYPMDESNEFKPIYEVYGIKGIFEIMKFKNEKGDICH